MGPVCTSIYRSGEFFPKTSFNSSFYSATVARRQSDETPIFNTVGEVMKLLANSYYDYQILDRSEHPVTDYLNEKKTLSAMNSKLLKKLDPMNHQFCKVELAEPEVEPREVVIVGLCKSKCNIAVVGALLQLFLIIFVILAGLRTWEWIQFLCILLLPKKS